MIICSLFHCPMQEYLKVERQMSDKRIQFISHVALRRVLKNLSYLLMVIFTCGCSQLPVKVGVERSEIVEESAEETRDIANLVDIKQSETEEGDSNPFDMGLSEDQQKLLKNYINNISNTNSLREYVDTQIPLVKSRISELSDKVVDDEVVKIKLGEVISQLDSISDGRVVKDSQVSTLLMSYELIKELEKHENN